MTKMNVAQLIAPGEPLKIGVIDKPVAGPTDVLVKVEACGIVPNAYNLVTGKSQHILPELPAVFGLDAAGTIEAVGEAVIGLEPGQRVYVDPYLTCETCQQCRRGRRDLCIAGTLRGYFSNTDAGRPLLNHYKTGGLSEYVLSPHRNIVRLPESIDMLTAARFGYLGTSFGALRRGGFTSGKTLLINGVTGTLGVAAVAIALGLGATKILGLGRNRQLLEQVQTLAPKRVVTCSTEDGGDITSWVKEQSSGGVDVMIDCLGFGADSKSTSSLIAAIKPGGRAILAAGGVDGQITQSYWEAYNDVSVGGSMWFSPEDIDRMVAMIDADVIDTSYLTHHSFALSEVNEALTFVGSRPGGFVNTVVIPNRTDSADNWPR
ncbi:hypothetical protein XU06_29375 (plasmid) [Rhodococcus erythropolis]|nr:hypothetical protein XU06_29375 [Rhodococcus erythropolis]